MRERLCDVDAVLYFDVVGPEKAGVTVELCAQTLGDGSAQ